MGWIAFLLPIAVAVCLRLFAKSRGIWFLNGSLLVSYWPLIAAAPTALCGGGSCEIDWVPNPIGLLILLISPFMWIHFLVTFLIVFFMRPDPKNSE